MYLFLGLALRCHVCTSGDKCDGDACKKLNTDEFITDCNELTLTTGLNYTYCRKLDQDGKDIEKDCFYLTVLVLNIIIIVILLRAVQGRHEIDRDCAVEGSGRCILRTGTKEIKLEYCECKGDLCNGASTIFSSVTTIAVPVIALLTMLLRSL